MKTITFELQPNDNEQLQNLCGHLDNNLRAIERHLAVEVNHRGHLFKIFGPREAITKAKQFIEQVYTESAQENLSEKSINAFLQSIANQKKAEEKPDNYDPNMLVKTSKSTLKPRGANQQRYLKRIAKHTINFGIGPAGTGKTFLAVASAVEALETEKVKRLILVRPAVEAGESLGFLPGDLAQKVDPYLRPMYDALYEFMGVEKAMKLMERQVIEVAPLAFMRGRSLNDAYILLDESQNTTPEQMKMFLTRIGFNSTAIVTGDITQTDLPKGRMSGLRHVINVLGETEGVSFTFFDSTDVVRHPMVQQVINAYDKYEKEHSQF